VVGLTLLTASVVAGASPATATSATASGGPPASAFVVDLERDGSARVALVTTFDLSTERGRSAFDRLRRNETAQTRLRGDFAGRMQAVARTAADETGREMRVRNPAIELAASNDTGVVSLSVTWTGIAAREGDRLVLGAPFDGGYEPGRQLLVRTPDGYGFTATTPAPDATGPGVATWDVGRSLDGFEAVVSADAAPETGDGDGGSSGVSAPGFGAGAAVAALLAVATLTRLH
jgi:PGF-CTERM protein